MDTHEKLFMDLINKDNVKNLHSFLDHLQYLITDDNCVDRTGIESDVIYDQDFLNEVQEFREPQVTLYFGKTLRDLKCVISDDNCREHVIWIQYIGPKILRIKDIDLPPSHIQDQDYKSINEIVNILKTHLAELSNYFDVLCRIDQCCSVLEPTKPTFREDYRKIQLVDKIWLHVEVSPNGSAKNLSFIGHYKQEFQELLQAWDHDKDIATNVLAITCSLDSNVEFEIHRTVIVPDCGICYCVELPGDTRVPQPLCNNIKCGAYFHRSCLYEWLVACSGGVMPQFGVGKCPSCSQCIQCSDKDT